MLILSEAWEEELGVNARPKKSPEKLDEYQNYTKSIRKQGCPEFQGHRREANPAHRHAAGCLPGNCCAACSAWHSNIEGHVRLSW